MAARDPADLLADILETATDVASYVEGMDADAFGRLPSDDRKTFRAIKNALSEIGEAVKNLPPDVTARHPRIDWRGMSGLRDIVAHQYHRLDTARLWPVIAEEFPELIAAVRAELGAPEPSA